MSTLDRYFEPSDDEEIHPKLRYWRSLLESGRATRAVCDFWRKRQGLSFLPARIYVFFFDAAGEPVDKDQHDWDPELNQELLGLGVRARDAKNEGERMGMMFGVLFEGVRIDFGEGFFNAVLLEQLHTSGLAALPPVAAVLTDIPSPSPLGDSPQHAACARAVDGVLSGAANVLTKRLGYSRDEATVILGLAMAYFLDERFSITNRRQLGFRAAS